jgi:hypothetical protein
VDLDVAFAGACGVVPVLPFDGIDGFEDECLRWCNGRLGMTGDAAFVDERIIGRPEAGIADAHAVQVGRSTLLSAGESISKEEKGEGKKLWREDNSFTCGNC